MEYQEITPITKQEAEKAFSSNDSEKICTALVAISFYEEDWKWAQDKCLGFLESEGYEFSSLAATCLGHIARVHGKLEKDKVMQALNRHINDPKISGYIEDAIGDINMFLKG
jgi:hypothetical protein